MENNSTIRHQCRYSTFYNDNLTILTKNSTIFAQKYHTRDFSTILNNRFL